MRNLILTLFCVVFLFQSFLSHKVVADNHVDTLDTSKIITCDLFGDTKYMDEVVVTGTRALRTRNNVSSPITIVGRKQLSSSGEISIMPILSKVVPGLFVTSRGVSGYGVSTGAAGGINLRGFSGASGRVLILIDGHPQYSGIYGHPISDSYITSDAERVEVFRGSASVLYGSNAMGGAINIITRKKYDDSHYVHFTGQSGSYGSLKFTLSDNYRKGKWSSYVGGSYDKTDGHRPSSAFRSISGMAKVGYDISTEWNLSANVNLVNFRFENPGDTVSPLNDSYGNITRGMSGISLTNEYGKTSGAVNFYYNWGIHNINDGFAAGGSPRPYMFHSTDYTGGVNVYQVVRTFPGNTITGGFDVKLFGGNAYRNPVTEIYADHKKLNEEAGYLFIQQNLWRFVLNAGIRYEHNSKYGGEWVPQAGFSYNVDNNSYVKFSYSKGFRTPNMRELYMYASANSELKPERSHTYDLSINRHFLSQKLYMELAAFFSQGDNIVETVREGGSPINRNVGSFINKGLEFETNYRILDNLWFSANYSYLRMYKSIVGSPVHKFYGEIVYLYNKLSIKAGVQQVNNLYLSTGNMAKTENFTNIDAKVSYSFCNSLGVFIKGDNLLCKSYQTILNYPMPRAVFMAGLTFNMNFNK